MKLSKTILTPIRATKHGGAISLSFFRRRLRLRPNGTDGPAFFRKKKGPTLENPEPSSPKVTCIGQVRVKSKKRAKQCRSLSKRRINGDVSFRKIDQSREGEEKVICNRSQRYTNGGGGGAHQRWVHIPVSVCDALRAFGAEFSCLFPCKSSCFSMRWLVPVNDGGGRRSREIEVVETAERVSRRHVFEDVEVKEQRIEVEEEQEEEEEEEARVSISIPPKNALLLMRCRSDPMKMAALANRFSFDAKCEDLHERANDDFHVSRVVKDEIFEALVQNVAVSVEVDNEEHEIQNEDESNLQMEKKELEIEEKLLVEEEKEEIESNMSSFEDLLDHEKTELYDKTEHYEETGESTVDKETEEEDGNQAESQLKIDVEKTHDPECEKREEKIELEVGNPKNDDLGLKNREIVSKLDKKAPVLPECLLLMMYEPKLSMEVSKETWVRSTDFVRWRPRKVAKEQATTKTGGACDHYEVKKRPSIDSKPKSSIPAPPAKKKNDQLQPARSSCTLPAASMATIIEQKLVSEGAYEAFALTRCKSEPMRTAAEKLGVGAAGVGF